MPTKRTFFEVQHRRISQEPVTVWAPLGLATLAGVFVFESGVVDYRLTLWAHVGLDEMPKLLLRVDDHLRPAFGAF